MAADAAYISSPGETMTAVASDSVIGAAMARWNDKSLSAEFVALRSTTSDLPALQELEAAGNTPLPYCTYEHSEATRINRQSKDADDATETWTQDLQFVVHAETKDTARDLILKIADAFDNAPLTVTESNASPLDCAREADFPARQADSVWRWAIRYSIRYEIAVPKNPT